MGVVDGVVAAVEVGGWEGSRARGGKEDGKWVGKWVREGGVDGSFLTLGLGTTLMNDCLLVRLVGKGGGEEAIERERQADETRRDFLETAASRTGN